MPTKRLATRRPLHPPVRLLTRATEADRVIGRYGWFAAQPGWLLVVAVSDPYALPGTDPTEPESDPADSWVHVLGRREWWQWGATGILDPDSIAAVPAEAVWLE